MLKNSHVVPTRRWLGLLLVVCAGLFLLVVPAAPARNAGAQALLGTIPQAPGSVITGHDLKHDVSPLLSSIPPIRPSYSAGNLPDRDGLERPAGNTTRVQDPVVQRTFGSIGNAPAPRPGANFD